MGKRIFDYNDGDYGLTVSDNMAIDADGNLLWRVGDSMAIDMESGDLHITSGWSESNNKKDD